MFTPLRRAIAYNLRHESPAAPLPQRTSARCRNVWYIYGMQKTTVYLSRELKQLLARIARQRRCSEAELLREAVARLADEFDAPAPKLPLFRSSGPSIAESVDDALEGLGRQ